MGAGPHTSQVIKSRTLFVENELQSKGNLRDFHPCDNSHRESCLLEYIPNLFFEMTWRRTHSWGWPNHWKSIECGGTGSV